MAETQRRLIVLVALGDMASSEQLAHRLSEDDGLVPVTVEDLVEGDQADVAIVDDETALGAWTPRLPLLFLATRPIHRPVAVAAVLARDAGTKLIAAAVRLAEAGYVVDAASAEPQGHGFGSPDDHQGGYLLVGGEAGHEASPIRFSPRELEVLALLGDGASNKAIARHLDISIHTAKFHVAAILVKLGAANRTDAIATAMRRGLLLV